MISEFQHWIDQNLPSQDGKTILITGGNSGIGYYAALALAKAGAHVVIAGRNPDRIDQAIKSIEVEEIDGHVEAGIVDLASLASVKQFSEQFRISHPKLDVLINNAGVMMPPESKTEDGFESQFGVNFLGHFALTGLLFDRLQSTAGSRVVTLSSIAHRGRRSILKTCGWKNPMIKSASITKVNWLTFCSPWNLRAALMQKRRPCYLSPVIQGSQKRNCNDMLIQQCLLN
jgi:NAD(P)-dependent dehydrogenase (short-subunit alcohol dehydrogenase family)